MERWPFDPTLEQAATVTNNNTPHWTVIVETKPNVTLDLGTKLYTQGQVDACITAALRWAAEQCELEASELAFVPTKGVATDCRDRILAALPERAQ